MALRFLKQPRRLTPWRPRSRAALAAGLLWPVLAGAGPLAEPGDPRLRHDLARLNDAGLIDLPLTTWPVSWAAIEAALAGRDPAGADPAAQQALGRVRDRLSREFGSVGADLSFGLSAASHPRVVRTFEDTPRDDGEASARLAWSGSRFALNLEAAWVPDPVDEEEFRPDGTYVGATLGNWLVSAGWQERWYGPGNDASLILGSNARPAPGVMLQRLRSTPFETRWLRWIGPWSLTTFMSRLDDERTVDDALLFGVRGTFRPLPGLEIGVSRTAEWCGDDRPCDFDTFLDLLAGNDNRGVNVDPADEPGNQLGGFDFRWSLPAGTPLAVYYQWIGEDGREGVGIGSWLKQLGFEYRGTFGGVSHVSHVEVADTTCHEGGFGYAEAKPDCAYNHSIYQTGYRYRQRVIGHSADGDSRIYSLGSTLVESAGHTWNATVRYMEINRAGAPDTRHSLTPTPAEQWDVQLTHARYTRFGRFHAGLGYRRSEDELSGASSDDVEAFLSWQSL